MIKSFTFYVVLFFSLLFFSPVAAQVTIDGEAFTKQYVAKPQNGDKLIEFIRDRESLDNWTKLVGYRYQKLPTLGNDPKRVAESMAKLVKKTNPKANFQIIENKKTSETLIDFLTWPPDQQYVELNVFRYAKSRDGKAVISIQLAFRFDDKSLPNVEQLKNIRSSCINQVAAFDIGKVHSALEK